MTSYDQNPLAAKGRGDEEQWAHRHNAELLAKLKTRPSVTDLSVRFGSLMARTLALGNVILHQTKMSGRDTSAQVDFLVAYGQFNLILTLFKQVQGTLGYLTTPAGSAKEVVDSLVTEFGVTPEAVTTAMRRSASEQLDAIEVILQRAESVLTTLKA